MNNGNISSEKKHKVFKAIEELNYIPNDSARNLASVNDTKRLKLIIPNINISCYTELINGFKDGAKLYNYDPLIEEYSNDLQKYKIINDNLLVTSEIKGVVQIGPKYIISNKKIVNLNDLLLKVDINEKYYNQKIGIFFKNDKILTEFFMERIFVNYNIVDITKKEKIDSSKEYYLTQTVEQAAFLINQGITSRIYTLEKTSELTKLIPNILHIPIDFYAIGVTLSRMVIKKITNRLDESQYLTLKI